MNGEVLYFIGSGALWKIVLSNGVASEVSRIPGRRITEIVAPIGSGHFWSLDSGRSMIVTTKDDETKQVGFYKIDLQKGRFSKLMEESKVYGGVFNLDVSDDGQQLVYLAQDAQHPKDFWVTTADFHSHRRVTTTAPLFDEYEMGTTRLLEWISVDGHRL